MASYEAKCNQCSFERELPDILRSYKVGENQSVTIEQTFAWCRTCKEIVWAERIEDITELETALPEVLEIFDAQGDALQKERDQFVEDMHRRIIWRKARVSPPKCLECGSTDIVPAQEFVDEDDGEEHWEVEHPECGGRLTIQARRGFFLNRFWIFYTPEGDKIAEYIVLPSKGLIERSDDENSL